MQLFDYLPLCTLNSQTCFTVNRANETYDENKRKEEEKWNEYKQTVQAYKKRCIITGRDHGRAAISNDLPGTTTSLEQIAYWMCGKEGIKHFKTKTMQQHVQIFKFLRNTGLPCNNDSRDNIHDLLRPCRGRVSESGEGKLEKSAHLHVRLAKALTPKTKTVPLYVFDMEENLRNQEEAETKKEKLMGALDVDTVLRECYTPRGKRPQYFDSPGSNPVKKRRLNGNSYLPESPMILQALQSLGSPGKVLGSPGWIEGVSFGDYEAHQDPSK